MLKITFWERVVGISNLVFSMFKPGCAALITGYTYQK